MTTEELKEKIAAAADTAWFTKVEGTFNFPHLGYVNKITGASAIYEFVSQQVDGWKKLGEPLPNDFINANNYFKNIQASFIRFTNNYINQTGGNLSNYWQNVRSNINNTSSKPFLYDAPETIFLLDVYRKYPNYFDGAYAVITGNNVSINSRDILMGSMLASEFLLKGDAKLMNRVSNEQKSIAELKNDFTNYLTESDATLIEHLKNANNKYVEYSKGIDQIKINKETLFDNWFNKTKNEDWENWFSPSKIKVGELENTYREKLKLEEPAKYWSERGKKLRKQGWIAFSVLIALVVFTCWSLGKILWKAPEAIYSSWFGNDKSAAIRWSIIYVTLISFIAFCIKSVTKVMFSSFHLARDSEERYTLTYFYLSLLKDSSMNGSERQLIMQSLFSRADTGLLKEDSAPTMPSDIVSKVIAK